MEIIIDARRNPGNCTIKSINFYKDDMIEMIVQCNTCKSINHHNVKHASTIEDKGRYISLNFEKLGQRCCDNTKTKVYHEYKLSS